MRHRSLSFPRLTRWRSGVRIPAGPPETEQVFHECHFFGVLSHLSCIRLIFLGIFTFFYFHFMGTSNTFQKGVYSIWAYSFYLPLKFLNFIIWDIIPSPDICNPRYYFFFDVTLGRFFYYLEYLTHKLAMNSPFRLHLQMYPPE